MRLGRAGRDPAPGRSRSGQHRAPATGRAPGAPPPAAMTGPLAGTWQEHDEPGQTKLEPGQTGWEPGSRSRKAAARSRRRSRITWVWAGAAVAVVLIVAAVVVRLSGHHAAPVSNDGFVTTFQRGEFKTVPNACTAVTGATLGQYLPGKRRMVAPRSLNGGAQSLCNWTLDAPPLYRVLEVNAQAYPPSGLATGNGSATNAATDAYQQALATMRHPLRATHLPPATVTELHGLRNRRVRRAPGGAGPRCLHRPGDRGGQGSQRGDNRGHAGPARAQREVPHCAAVPRLQSGAIAAATDISHGLHSTCASQPRHADAGQGPPRRSRRGRRPSRGSGGHPRLAASALSWSCGCPILGNLRAGAAPSIPRHPR